MSTDAARLESILRTVELDTDRRFLRSLIGPAPATRPLIEVEPVHARKALHSAVDEIPETALGEAVESLIGLRNYRHANRPASPKEDRASLEKPRKESEDPKATSAGLHLSTDADELEIDPCPNDAEWVVLWVRAAGGGIALDRSQRRTLRDYLSSTLGDSVDEAHVGRKDGPQREDGACGERCLALGVVCGPECVGRLDRLMSDPDWPTKESPDAS